MNLKTRLNDVFRGFKMTKEEMATQIEAIKKQFGEPEWDMHEAVNESAKKIKAIRRDYASERLTAARAIKTENDGLRHAAENIDEKYKHEIAQPIYLTDQDLAPFDELEQKIIAVKFENQALTNRDIADRLGIRYQSVGALFSSTAFKLLASRIYDRLLPLESLAAIRKAINKGDSKTALEVARHYKLISNEALDINQPKPISDPEALRMLRDIGDRVLDDEGRKKP